MKDAYSFDVDFAGAETAYFAMFHAYLKAFRRMGLTAIPLQAVSGAIGGKLSHEFHVVAETGESALYYDAIFEELSQAKEPDIAAMRTLYAAADEKHDPAQCPVPKARLRQARGIEVGHIFYFGTKYSAAMGATITNAEGKETLVEMGSYGIGVSRLVGAIIEASHDDKGIIWPESVAPFRVGLININAKDEACIKACDRLYTKLIEAGVTVLYDDRKESAGAKFAAMDLIGLPWQIALGPRGLEQGKAECKNRATGDKAEVGIDEVIFSMFSARP